MVEGTDGKVERVVGFTGGADIGDGSGDRLAVVGVGEGDLLATVRRVVIALVVLPPSVGVNGNDIVRVRVHGTARAGNTVLRVESGVTTGVDLRRSGRTGGRSRRRRGGCGALLRRGRRGGSRLLLRRRSGGSALLSNLGDVIEGRSGLGSSGFGRSSLGSSGFGRGGYGSGSIRARSVVVLRLGLDISRGSSGGSGGSTLGHGGVDRGDISRVGSAVRSTVVGKSLVGEERVTAVVEEGGVVLGVAREGEVPGVVGVVVLKVTLGVTGRLGPSTVDGGSNDDRSRSKGDDSSLSEHFAFVLLVDVRECSSNNCQRHKLSVFYTLLDAG